MIKTFKSFRGISVYCVQYCEHWFNGDCHFGGDCDKKPKNQVKAVSRGASVSIRGADESQKHRTGILKRAGQLLQPIGKDSQKRLFV